MSLPACQERILTGIETALKTGEPRLASRFAIFTRLTAGEALPRREQIEQKPWLTRVGGLRRVLLIPIVLIMLASAVVAASIASASSCVAARQPVTWVAARWHSCAASGAPARGTRTADLSTQGTPK